MKVAFNCTYYAGALSIVDLPVENWDQVKDYYIKWDTLFYLLDGDEEFREIELNSDTSDAIDWKRPSTISVYGTNPDGNPHWEEVLDEY